MAGCGAASSGGEARKGGARRGKRACRSHRDPVAQKRLWQALHDLRRRRGATGGLAASPGWAHAILAAVGPHNLGFQTSISPGFPRVCALSIRTSGWTRGMDAARHHTHIRRYILVRAQRTRTETNLQRHNQHEQPHGARAWHRCAGTRSESLGTRQESLQTHEWEATRVRGAARHGTDHRRQRAPPAPRISTKASGVAPPHTVNLGLKRRRSGMCMDGET